MHPGNSLGHNPNADEAERLRVRETFNLKDHLAGTIPAVHPDAPPVVVTKEQVLILAKFYGIEVISTGGKNGRDLNLEEKYEVLKVENEKLLERCRVAEAKVVVETEDSEADIPAEGITYA